MKDPKLRKGVAQKELHWDAYRGSMPGEFSKNGQLLLEFERQIHNVFYEHPATAPGALVVGGQIFPHQTPQSNLALALNSAPPVDDNAMPIQPETCAACHLDPMNARLRMIAEAFEFHVQTRPLAKQLYRAPPTADENKALPLFYGRYAGEAKWLQAQALDDGMRLPVPASLCHDSVRPDGQMISLGVSAGYDDWSSMLSGLCEVIEHWAIAACLRCTDRQMAGNSLRPVDLSMSTYVQSWLQKARQNADHRLTRLLHVGAPFGVHVCLALSQDKATKDHFISASCADISIQNAVTGALRELVQFEFGTLINKQTAQCGAYHDAKNNTRALWAWAEQSFNGLSANYFIKKKDDICINPQAALRSVVSDMNDKQLKILAVPLHLQPKIVVTKVLVPGLITDNDIMTCEITK